MKHPCLKETQRAMKIHTPYSPLNRGETLKLPSIKRGWGCVIKVFSGEDRGILR